MKSVYSLFLNASSTVSKNKVKLSLYKSFCKEIEFKNYLQGVGDPGTRLMFKFRSGTNGLNEDVGVKMVIGSVSYVGMNVRVWYMCSGSVLYMIALQILSWES